MFYVIKSKKHGYLRAGGWSYTSKLKEAAKFETMDEAVKKCGENERVVLIKKQMMW